MPLLVTSKDNSSRWALYTFLREHGVEIPRSEDFQAIGRLSPHTRNLIGVVGYNGFSGRTCMMHLAGEGNWVTRDFLWAAFDYPFNQLDIVQIFGCLSVNNTKAMKFNRHLGLHIWGVVPDGWAVGENMVVMSMVKRECRWLKKPEHKRELEVA